MYVKKVRRKCDVRNCKNKDCYAISRSREVGNTIIACADCLKEALEAIDKLPKETPKAKSSGIPSLFFNTKDDKQENEKAAEPIATDETVENADVVNENVDETAETIDTSETEEPDAPVDASDADATEGDAVYSDKELLEGMTVKELKAFADEIGVDVSKCKVKADFVEAIKAVTSAELFLMKGCENREVFAD